MAIMSRCGLRIDRGLYDRVIAHLSAVYPLEGVGLLAGVTEGSVVRGLAFHGGTNADASTTRYTMEPEEVLAAFREMEEHDQRLVAIVHSHPNSAPVPSETDLREAYYPEALLLIVGLGASSPEARCWKLRSNALASSAPLVEEVSLVVDPPRARSGDSEVG